MIKYAVYFGAAVLIIWSVFYVVRAIYRQSRGKRGCGGNCGGCRLDCPDRKAEK